MWIVPALIILPSEVLLKLSSRPPVAKRAAVVPSQATDDPAYHAREEEGGWNRGTRRPLGPGIDVKKSYESTFACECRGTDHTFLALQMAF